eukprot:gnl/MRDRNA2_/MRDRNA2_14941_c0_seq1.p1 gnl/MRDRNA2_/MRDRNA2_14941_c0~~gnl/MRDRNA2_/MRDRNA2_14941_c0_seq1.p1  ORF type:complete len:484 (+),score=62.06 gnl/MRDRNA2_/MRDRNA2_14941_c0_seq1:76-1527(+)
MRIPVVVLLFSCLQCAQSELKLDELTDDLVDKLLSRLLSVWPLRAASLNGATLAKTHPGRLDDKRRPGSSLRRPGGSLGQYFFPTIEEDQDLSTPGVEEKYHKAGSIANGALKVVIAACIDGADIHEICELGDRSMNDQCSQCYTKKEKVEGKKEGRTVQKGIAFPTCISCNEISGHYSPLRNESLKLNAGDVVKIDMACHIDGFIAAVGHTIIVPGGGPIDKRKADVIHAAWNAGQAALRLLKVGNGNRQIVPIFQRCANEFNVEPVSAVMSHIMRRYEIMGNKLIPQRIEEMQEDFIIQPYEVYCIDILFTNGVQDVKDCELATTLYILGDHDKRSGKALSDMLRKIPSDRARDFLNQVHRNHPHLPFSLRSFPDKVGAKVGSSIGMKKELLQEYSVVGGNPGDTIAQFKFTVLITPTGVKKISGVPLSDDVLKAKTNHSINDPWLKQLLALAINPKAKKKANSTQANETIKASTREANKS